MKHYIKTLENLKRGIMGTLFNHRMLVWVVSLLILSVAFVRSAFPETGKGGTHEVLETTKFEGKAINPAIKQAKSVMPDLIPADDWIF